MKRVALIALFGTICLAEQTGRPACTARNQGQLWPDEANFRRDAARQLYQRGELEMCSMAVWKYKWQQISVNVRNLTKTKRPSAPESGSGGAGESR